MQEVSELLITPAEWDIMRIIWTVPGSTSREISRYLQEKHDWSESTVKTLLRRLVAKEFVETEPGTGRSFIYKAIVSEEDTMKRASIDLFSSLCAMKRGGTLADLVAKLELSQSDLQKLQEVVTQKLTTAPLRVSCDCLGAEANCCTMEGESKNV